MQGEAKMFWCRKSNKVGGARWEGQGDTLSEKIKQSDNGFFKL